MEDLALRVIILAAILFLVIPLQYLAWRRRNRFPRPYLMATLLLMATTCYAFSTYQAFQHGDWLMMLAFGIVTVLGAVVVVGYVPRAFDFK